MIIIKIEMPVSKSIYKIAKQVQKVNSEKKSLDWNVNSSVGTGGAYVSPLFALNQGDSATQRVGDRITLSSFNMNYTITMADTTNIVRAIVFQWHSSDAAVVPTSGAILESAFTPVGMEYLSFYQRDTPIGKFTVLYDRTHVLTTGSGIQKTYKVKINKFPVDEVNFTVNSPGANLGLDMIYTFFISDSSVTVDPRYQIVGRINFFDS